MKPWVDKVVVEVFYSKNEFYGKQLILLPFDEEMVHEWNEEKSLKG